MKKGALFLAVISTIVLCIIGSMCGIKRSKEVAIQKQTRFLLDTYCTIQIPGNTDVLPLIDKAFDRIEYIDKKFNILNKESPLFDFNTGKEPIHDKETCNLIRTALDISKQSGGCFDITVYPLLKLWGFYSGNHIVPAKEEIADKLTHIGYRRFMIRNDTVIDANECIKVDLGGIAKGYAVQEAVEVLKRAGVTSALIDAGGDIYALGADNGTPWKIGIRNPRGEGVIGILEVSDMSLATSGDYERFFEKDGIKYHHIFDPATGYPAQGMISVTVLCKDAVKADAWSTALFVMGPDKALETVENTADLEAVLVTAGGKILYSSGLKNNLELRKMELFNEN